MITKVVIMITKVVIMITKVVIMITKITQQSHDNVESALKRRALNHDDD